MAVEHTLERSVIGRLVLDPARLYDVRLEPEDFRDPWCRKAFKAISQAVTLHDPEKVDALVIEEACGGDVDASDLNDCDPCIDAVIEHHAEKIRAIGLRAKVRLTAEKIAQSEMEGDDLLAHAMTAFNGLGSAREETSVSLRDSQRETWAEYLAAKKGEKRGLATGHKAFDDFACLERGGVTIVAGRPSMGKSAFALWLSRNLTENNERVLVFSTEMGHRKWSRRMMCAEARVNSQVMTTGTGTITELERLKAASIQTANLPIWIDDRSDRLKELVLSIRRHRQRHNITLAVVDHLQECIPGKEPHRELTELLGALRSVTREAPKISLVLVSQLNRGLEQRAEKIPLMSDLRESGRIEEVADSVLLCYRPYYYDQKRDQSEFMVGVAKNRDGRTGRICMSWDYKNGYVTGVRKAEQDEQE